MSRRNSVRRSILNRSTKRSRRRRRPAPSAMEYLEQRTLLSAVSGAVTADALQAEEAPICEITDSSFTVENGTATLTGTHMADTVDVATLFGQVFFSISNATGTTVYSVSDSEIDAIEIAVHCGNDSVTVHDSVTETLTVNGSSSLNVERAAPSAPIKSIMIALSNSVATRSTLADAVSSPV